MRDPSRQKNFTLDLAAFRVAAALCGCWALAATSALGQDTGKTAKPNSEAEHCRTIKDERMRTRCLQEENSNASVNPSQQQPAATETWRLARSPNPAGGPDTVSITKLLDTTQNDKDVAGLTLRCAEGATTEVLVDLVQPLPVRTHPKVTVVAGRMTTEFIGSVVTPGALVLLPEKASALVENAWQSVPELAVAIVDNHRSLRGVIPVADLASAMQTLQENCPKAPHARRPVAPRVN
jgi:hypothetical protein